MSETAASPTETTMTPEEIVLAFYEAWDTVGFAEAYRTWLHPDVTVENPQMPHWKGLDTVMSCLDAYMKVFKRPYAKVEVHHLAVNGNVVLTERTEHNRNEAGDDVYTGQLMTTFVIEDGKIKRWAEYYDITPYQYGAALPVAQLTWES